MTVRADKLFAVASRIDRLQAETGRERSVTLYAEDYDFLVEKKGVVDNLRRALVSREGPGQARRGKSEKNGSKKLKRA